MTNNNYNFGLIANSTNIKEIEIQLTSDGSVIFPNNNYINVTYSTDTHMFQIFALQNISLAFSQKSFNQNYTQTVLNIELNPTYISQTDPSYSANGDECNLTLWRCLEQGYGIQFGLTSGVNYNIYLLILE